MDDLERLTKERDEALTRAHLQAEMSGAIIIEAIGPDEVAKRMSSGKPIYKDEALNAIKALRARVRELEAALEHATYKIRAAVEAQGISEARMCAAIDDLKGVGASLPRSVSPSP